MTRLMSRHVPIEMALLWLFELALSFAVIYVLTGPLGSAIPLAPMHAPNLAKLPHAALLAGILALSGISIGLYRTEICLDRRRVLLNAALAAVLAFPVALIVSGRLADGIELTYAVWLVKVLVLWFGFVLLSRSALRVAFKHRLFVRRLLVVGAAPAADGPPRRSPQEMPPETWQPRHGKMFDLVFPGADGQPLSPGQVHGHSPRFDKRTGKKTHPGNGFYKARDQIGRPDFRFHDLRHFAATMAAISGATTKELMQFAGHSDIHAAMRYQEAITDRKRDLAHRMAALAGIPAELSHPDP